MNKQNFNRNVLGPEFNSCIVDLGENKVTYSKSKIGKVITKRIIREFVYECYQVTRNEIKFLAKKELKNLLRVSRVQKKIYGAGPNFVS